ncbi:TAXI family TRAP transporter solute-binding subunit [Marinobacterium litorale]|uniref:TAXI family TRAP transporter solute-binding subunit n=1 Tax=Marinobacterium litorale TaxID=404770 RepID=UPI0003FEACB5|nr:TAXI family TRAP transporter solute-binding subunit [Marinobacterium litorale]
MKISSKWVRKSVCAVAATLAANIAQAAPVAMETSGASSVLGVIPQAMAPHWARDGIDLQLITDQTLTKSLLKIGQGTLDTALVPPLAYNALSNGAGPYAGLGDKAVASSKNVRALFAIPGSPFHPIVWADSGIKTWADAEQKRIYIGPPAGAANRQLAALIKEGGLEENQYLPIKAPWGAATQGFQDGQYDVYIGAFGLGSQVLTELSLSRDMFLLSLPEDSVPPKGWGLRKVVIPAGTYAGQTNEEAVTSWGTVMMMAARKGLSDDVAYQLTKTYMEQREAVSKSNPVLSLLVTTEPFEEVNAPLHPGAVRYYKEVGIEIPEELLPPSE